MKCLNKEDSEFKLSGVSKSMASKQKQNIESPNKVFHRILQRTETICS